MEALLLDLSVIFPLGILLLLLGVMSPLTHAPVTSQVSLTLSPSNYSTHGTLLHVTSVRLSGRGLAKKMGSRVTPRGSV